MVWHIGNTTVRTPYRLREALKVLEKSSLIGNLGGKHHGGAVKEQEFATLLHSSGVANISRVQEGKDASDVGRKWRVALCQLGFITPDRDFGTSKPAYIITTNGKRLIESEIITAQQECFLRSLVAYQLPNCLENKTYKFTVFSPLRFVLQVLFGLNKAGHEPRISFTEFAAFVQTKTSILGTDEIVNKIIEYRQNRDLNKGNLRRFKKDLVNHIVAEIYPDAGNKDTKSQTLRDYADLTLRYLKATGLFKAKGRGIVISPVRQKLCEFLSNESWEPLEDESYFPLIWEGAKLPTDNKNEALRVIEDLANRINMMGGNVSATTANLSDADIEVERHRLEHDLIQREELEYARYQAGQTEEISTWLRALCNNKREAKSASGELFKVPKGEAPAYLEWAVWRAFLAINSLSNQPWESRRFQVDQDFLPTGTAPGGGADMIFEFDDIVVVTEVTLTSSSRQEAAEGEPVRRHVAKYMDEYQKTGKNVYGLFLAVSIDSNTAHTFKHGDWYLKDDTKVNLDIVPIALEDFTNFFSSNTDKLNSLPSTLKLLLLECRAKANLDAPQWKNGISKIIENYTKKQ